MPDSAATPANRWDRVKAIVSDAAELAPAERPAFVLEACGGDAVLRAEVERLLVHVDQDDVSELLPAANTKEPDHMLAVNETLCGRFRIVRFIGAGGMGEVYEAHDLELGVTVALKTLRADLVDDAQFAARFRREVQLARQVTHPNVCRVFDLGHDRNRTFLSMELLDGETLRQLLRRTGSLPVEQALPMVQQIASGLAALHERGIVHRDLKPGNVMVTREGRAVLSDFGLARGAAAGNVTVTNISRVGQLLGTPDYMAPEQFLGIPASAASDIYALGMVMQELLTGSRHDADLTSRGVPLAWAQTIRRCLERDPARRPASVKEAMASLADTRQAGDSWGAFRLIGRVGVGGFGEVYRAFDPTLERDVALKLLHSADGSASVVSEARAMAKVRHPNVVVVHGVDERDGRVGLWSDFVRGKTLTELLAVQGAFSAREAAAIGVEVCKAVAAVHAAGLVHRDIKASNIMREEGGRIVLMDFGLSQSAGDAAVSSGTLAYLAPEVEAGGAATARSDIYAIGVLLFQLVTAKLPSSARPLLEERPDLPPPLARAIDKARHADLAQRYASAAELLAALPGEPPASAIPLQTPAAARWWRLALPVAALLGVALYWVRPGVAPLTGKPTGAHATFLQAQEALDHYYRPNGTQKAAELFQKTVAEDPKFAAAHAGLARASFLQYWQLRDPKFVEPTLSAATMALALDRSLAPVHVTLGMLYTQTGRSELAAQEINEALKLDPRNGEVHYALALLYSKQGRLDEVVPRFQRAMDLNPRDWRFPNELASHYLTVGKLNEAIASYQQAAALSPDNPRPLSNLGVAYRRSGRIAEAIATLRKAQAVEPSFSSWLNLGVALEYAGKLKEAAGCYQQAVKLSPNNATAWGNLGAVYSALPGRNAEMRQALREAVRWGEALRKTQPNDASLVGTLSVHYARLGDAEHSDPLKRQALALAPDDPEVLFQLATAQELLGRRAEALRLLGVALSRGLSVSIVRGSYTLANLRQDAQYAQLILQYESHPKKE